MTEYDRRPEFIDRRIFRAWVGRADLDRLVVIAGIRATSYIYRCQQRGRPVPMRVHNGRRCWRPCDLVAFARAHGVTIEPAPESHAAVDAVIRTAEGPPSRKIQALQAEIESLRSDLAFYARAGVVSRGHTGHIAPDQGLLSESDIVDAKCPVPEMSGIYFLIRAETVMYVGQSVNVWARVQEHRRNRAFDSVTYMPCPLSQLNYLESLYIHHLRPQWNGYTDTGGRRWLCAPLCADALAQVAP